MQFELIATATFGIESITAKELRALGYDDLKVENGKVTFEGDEMDVAIANTWLRTAERVLIKVKEFKATSFEELFNATKAVDWWKFIPENGFIHVTGKSIKATLHSVPDCQSIVKKAIVKSMQEKYNVDWLKEDGPEYKVEVAILKDVVTLTIDTSGPGLHKRGYRANAGAAPLKETLAAALVLISKWDNNLVLEDPFCGSGTILIEAALIGKNISPGLNRKFVCEEWPLIGKEVFDEVRENARNVIKNDVKLTMMGYDIDGRVLATARANAKKAGVGDCIHFQRRDVKDFSSNKKCGIMITNPPYGERLSDEKEVQSLYKILGDIKRSLDTWDLYVLTSYEKFERYLGRKSDKNRKLYNGKIKCYYYQYFDNKNAKNRKFF